VIDLNLFAAILAVLAALGVFAWHVYSHSLAIQCWWVNLGWSFDYWRRRAGEKLALTVAWRVPRWLAYWCAVRVIAEATGPKWAGTVVPELTAMDALKRWEDRQ